MGQGRGTDAKYSRNPEETRLGLIRRIWTRISVETGIEIGPEKVKKISVHGEEEGYFPLKVSTQITNNHRYHCWIQTIYPSLFTT